MARKDKLLQQRSEFASREVQVDGSATQEQSSTHVGVPWLSKRNLESGRIVNGGLVRYRCMVQDIFDPEYYLESYVIKEAITGAIEEKQAKYLESIPPCPDGYELCQPSLSRSRTSERLPVFGVPIPCESSWTAESDNPERAPVACSVSRKRSLDVSADKTGCEIQRDKENRPKRVPKEGMADKVPKCETNYVEHLQRWKPIKEDNGTCCILKLYDKCFVKLQDIVEVVGYISTKGSEVNFASQDKKDGFDAFLEFEDYGKSPPTSLVPRIHCIEVKVLNPSKDLEVYSSLLFNYRALSKSRYLEMREQTILYLLPVVAGDRLAAEYLLLWALSGIFQRQCPGDLLGKFSFALTRFGLDAPCSGRHLFSTLCRLFPRCHYFGLTVDILNADRFVPYKDYNFNRLCSGRLQACNNTPLVVDETTMDSGKLDSNGLTNLNALSQVARDQTVTYDFQYYKSDWDVDLPFLVLSNASKPLVTGIDCACPILPQGAYGTPPEIFSREKLRAMRSYVATVRDSKSEQFNITDEASTTVEEFYVRRRQQSENASQADLNRWLCMSRFWELSVGSTEFTDEGWKFIQRLELDRLTRV